MDPIWDYLVDGTLSSDPKEASKLRARSARFTVHRGTLYKRGFSTPILKCIGKEDANYILREVHEGTCGNHIGARTLAGRTLRQGYYWPTMLKDAQNFIPKQLIFSSTGKNLLRHQRGNGRAPADPFCFLFFTEESDIQSQQTDPAIPARSSPIPVEK